MDPYARTERAPWVAATPLFPTIETPVAHGLIDRARNCAPPIERPAESWIDQVAHDGLGVRPYAPAPRRRSAGPPPRCFTRPSPGRIVQKKQKKKKTKQDRAGWPRALDPIYTKRFPIDPITSSV
jgi:hypothetical protein